MRTPLLNDDGSLNEGGENVKAKFATLPFWELRKIKALSGAYIAAGFNDKHVATILVSVMNSKLRTLEGDS